jgi:hypothetical protein
VGGDRLQPRGRRHRARDGLPRSPVPGGARARGRPVGVPRRLGGVRARLQRVVPDRGAQRAGCGCGAPAGGLAPGARLADRLRGRRDKALDAGGDLRAGSRAGPRRRAHAGVRLARDLRGSGAGGGARPRRRAPRPCPPARVGGLAALARAHAAREHLPRVALRGTRRRALPGRPARDQRLGLHADRGRGNRQRAAARGDRGPPARAAALRCSREA